MSGRLEDCDQIIEDILEKGATTARKILSENTLLLLEVSSHLSENGRMTPEEFKKVCHEHGHDIETKPSKHIVIYGYSEILKSVKKEFKNNKNKR